jgi:electron transfer flavoprotein beta subunit
LIAFGGECFHCITFYKEYKNFPLKQTFPLLFYNRIIIKTFVSSSIHAQTSPFCAYFLPISFCRSNCLSKFAVGILLIPNILKYMSLKIVVLAKQVPDTRNVGKDAMNADGTINRAALPAIFNPEDLNALEQALRLKDTHPGSTVTILTMGPGRAAEIIREGLYRGADNGYLLTDRAFAGADTLATSYAIATAIRKIGECDLIIGGRQAIDGDTAQVGPQVAEKLGLSQITYTEEILNVDETARRITVKRHIDGGVETVEGPLPIVLTVNGSAAPCRPRNAKLLQKYKRALGAQEKAAITKDGSELPYAELYEKFPYLNITEWSVADVEGDTKQCGLSGSPTKVKKIENIVFQAKESKTMTGSDQDVEGLIVELLANHTIG